jgi:hypothetical protein
MIPGLDQSGANALDELLAEIPETGGDIAPSEAAPIAVEPVSRALPPRAGMEAMSEIERRWRARLKPAVSGPAGKPSPLQKEGGPLSWMV